MTSKTVLNTKIKGQIGYTGHDTVSKIDEAKKMYSEYMWIIK